MIESEQKFIKLGIDPDVAHKLVEGGIDTPRKIKEATNKALEDAGLTETKVTNLRKRYPKEKA
jgi:hypothetical protein